MLVLALALAPTLLLLLWVYREDQHEPEPRGLVLVAFALGAIAVPLCASVERYLLPPGFPRVDGITLLGACFLIACCEELAKFLPLNSWLVRHAEFDEPLDGIVYGAAISLGFAAAENLLYALSQSPEILILRMFTAVPAHASFGILMGFFVGAGKFLETHRTDPLHPVPGHVRSMYGLAALASSVFVHGVYDFLLLSNQLIGLVLGLVLVLWSLLVSKQAIRIHQRSTKRNLPQSTDVS